MLSTATEEPAAKLGRHGAEPHLAAFAVLDTDPEASVLLALEAVDRLEAAGQEVPGNLLDVLNNARS